MKVQVISLRVAGVICLFFIIRIIAEFTYFGINPSSIVIMPVCILPVILFSTPIVCGFLENNRAS